MARAASLSSGQWGSDMTILANAAMIRPGLVLSILFIASLATGCAGRAMPGQLSPMEEGALLWSMTCSHCHNLRPIDQYVAEDWSIIVDHMRVRAGLTKSEANSITRFLQGVADSGASSR